MRTSEPQDEPARPAPGRRGRVSLVSALAAVALLALSCAATAGARVIRDAGALPAAESAPTVSQQPADTTVSAGASAKFISFGSGTPAPTVQWERSTNGGSSYQAIEGATSTTFTI